MAVVPADTAAGLSDCDGIVAPEDGPSIKASAKGFIGRRVYSNHGDACVREFLPDGSMRLSFNGHHYPAAAGSTYTVADGVLTVRTAREGRPERHMLRDDGTPVFLDRPYRNARRE